MIIYFSGTGNSRFAANFLKNELGDQIVDAGELIKTGRNGDFQSEKPWVFVAPTYSWQMPRLFAEFIRKSRFSGSQAAYFVLTCGGEIGGAGQYAKALAGEKGLEYRGILPVHLPENLITLFKAPEEDRIREMLQAARPVLKAGAKTIGMGGAFSEARIGTLDKLKSGPVNQGFYRFFLKSQGFYATDACISCGKCADRCVLNNIHLAEGRPVWGNRCTQCMACISICPSQAIEYGKRTQGKKRYWCPETE